MSRIRPLFVAAVALGLLLGISAPAGATVIGLSEASSSNTPPSALSANFDFQVSGSTLTLAVTNFSAYDITELYFNTTNDIGSLSLDQPPTNAGWALSAGPIHVAGFGQFDWGVVVTGNVNTSTATIQNGTSQTLQFTITCSPSQTCDVADFGEENSKHKAIAAKFVAGPLENSAYGASGGSFPAVPEPATAALLGMGLVGLGWAGRGQKR